MSDLSGNAIPGSIEAIRCGLSSPCSTLRRELTDVTQERDRLRSEAERLRGLVKKAFSEGFWNGVATHRGPDSDELGKIKEDKWRSSITREGLNTEDEG